jgi:thioredoxin-related protein
MADERLSNQDAPPAPEPKETSAATEKKSSRSLLIIFLIFAGFLAIVFLTQRKEPIDWIEDYEAGLESAKQQNKPVLLAFYKQFTTMSTSAFNDTYKDPEVKKFVEQNFVPILIDVDKHPELAEKYDITYYPTHYVKRPDGDELFGPRLGYDPPALFIKELKRLLRQTGRLDE